MDLQGEREQLLRRGYEAGVWYEKTYHGCSQCVLAAIMDVMGERDDQVFRSASGLAGGLACSSRATCGALIGGIMAISQRYGRERNKFDDVERIRFRCYEISRKLLERFESEYGGSRCADIQIQLMGRSFDLLNPADWEEFVKAGGHDTHCPSVVGNAVKWTIEVLLGDEYAYRHAS